MSLISFSGQHVYIDMCAMVCARWHTSHGMLRGMQLFDGVPVMACESRHVSHVI